MTNQPISGDEARAADRQRSCMEKLTWRRTEDAAAAASYAVWQYGDDSARNVPYQCRFCGLWHLKRDYIDQEEA